MCEISKMLVDLQEVIVSRFVKEEDFSNLLFKNNEKFDYRDAEGKTPPARILNTIREYYARGLLPEVIRLAELVLTVSSRKDLRELIEKMKACAGQMPENGTTEIIERSMGSVLPLPKELLFAFTLYQNQRSLTDFAVNLRPKFRVKSYREFDLPGRLFQSRSDEYRLAAVLALESEPNAIYLRWQAELVAVDAPFVGLTAAQSLIAAALHLDHKELPWVRLATAKAIDLLTEMTPSPADRKREVQRAQTLCDMRDGRVGGTMSTQDLEDFLKELTHAFDLDRLQSLCTNRLNTALKMLARPTDPPEYIIVSLVTKARESDWEIDLIRGVWEEQPTNRVLAAIKSKYANV